MKFAVIEHTCCSCSVLADFEVRFSQFVGIYILIFIYCNVVKMISRQKLHLYQDSSIPSRAHILLRLERAVNALQGGKRSLSIIELGKDAICVPANKDKNANTHL